MPKFDLEAVLQAVPKYKINALPLIPTTLQRVLDAAEKRKVDFSSVLVISSGAGFTPGETMKRSRKVFKSLMMRPINGYGLTETVSR